jgi:hypothetical protein
MPSSALTRFLKQGLTRGMCPLCRVAHKLDREWTWSFFDVYSGEDWALDALRRSRGLCADHAEQLRRLEVDGIKSTLVVSSVYLDTLEGVAAQLEGLGTDDEQPAPPCPACVNRDQGVEKNAGYLLAELDESERSRERFVASPGLCFRHFDLVWGKARRDQRELLLEVQRRSVGSLVEQLREHIRKQGHEARDEPKGNEEDSWLRAIWLTAGWPADPGESLAEAVADPGRSARPAHDR